MEAITNNPNSESSSESSYETAFARLEEILHLLETGELPLEEALTLYEEGAMLTAYCNHKLEEAELRVRQWQPGDQTTVLAGWQEG